MARRSALPSVLYQRTALVPDYRKLEESLGHRFADTRLLQRALTHSSHGQDNYERLEFLGDRVLALVMAEWLSELKPVAGEGELAKSLASLVARDSVAEVARRVGIAPYLRVSGKDAALQTRDNPTILGDVCEAVIAALYLDAGLGTARGFIRRHWLDLLSASPQTGDAKTQLQEWSQGRGLGLPQYAEIGRHGLDHAPTFVVEVTVARDTATGQGASKRIAEREAAINLLRQLEEKS